jgi:hypothetical protein
MTRIVACGVRSWGPGSTDENGRIPTPLQLEPWDHMIET